jgi:hypothetical protein
VRFARNAQRPVAQRRVVRVQRTSVQNNIPLFFARILGFRSATASTEARGPLTVLGFKTRRWHDIGFTVRADVRHVERRRSAERTATAMTPRARGDPAGRKECNLFPQGTTSAGNRGTIDIGGRTTHGRHPRQFGRRHAGGRHGGG